jgi:hypothetical protein
MPKSPLKLPFCSFPKAADISLHGMQELPEELPTVDLAKGSSYRSDRYKAIPLRDISIDEIDQCGRLIAASFVANEPMNKHLIRTDALPPSFEGLRLKDAFGESEFGPLNQVNIFYWFVRVFLLTESKEGFDYPILKEDLINHSFAIKDGKDEIIGVSLGEQMKVKDESKEDLHPFAEFASTFKAPILDFLHEQDDAAMDGLFETYADFKTALAAGKVGGVSMIAKNDHLPSEHAFELFAVVVEHFKSLGYEYAITGASNQWTGAAAELINGVRAHFYPYRFYQIKDSPYTTTSDGYISYKDSGIMFYIMKL